MIKQNYKKEVSHFIVIFTGIDHGTGSSAAFVDMKCPSIYSSCYSSTKMSIISKVYEKVLRLCFCLIKLYNRNEVIIVHQRFPLFFISL